MTDTLPFIRKFLESTKLDFEIIDCEPDLADTNIFCKKYNIKFEILGHPGFSYRIHTDFSVTNGLQSTTGSCELRQQRARQKFNLC